MFQKFDAPPIDTEAANRLSALRAVMSTYGLDVVIVPHADEFRNEYLPPAHERLAWLTGFTGSAGEAVVTTDQAVLFVDGRYTLQAADQVDDAHWQVESLIDLPPAKWLGTIDLQGKKVGFDPALHTANEVKKLTGAVERNGGTLVEADQNLIDAIWEDRPAPPRGPVTIHDFELAGRTTRDKLAELRDKLTKNDAELCVLTDPTSVSWLFNIRGSDVAHTPLVLARAIIPMDGEPTLFVDDGKLDIEVRAFLTQVATLEPEDRFLEVLAQAATDSKILLDPDLTSQVVFTTVEEVGANVVRKRDPVALPRAVKNEAEIEGSRAAHLRDGAAVTTFLHWLDNQEPGSITEIDAVKRLETFRHDMAGNRPLRDLSFDTISGSGPNGAIVHYRVTEDTNRRLNAGELYLCDSGGQYDDGTTDITRTVVVGEPDRDQRRAFTLVLKGHIAIATARFPKGTRGMDIDVLARIALWQHGMDYAHGTGHGIGSFLSVHEGPQNISRRGSQELLPGMIISNEPGYYRTGAFGIRIENLILVRDATEIPGGDKPMLGFETLTLAPIDNRLIDPTMMTDDELHWLNAYHGWVRRQLTPLVDDTVAEWLARATEPMVRELPAASA